MQTDKKCSVKILIHYRHLLSESVVSTFSPLQFLDMTKLSATNGRLSAHGRRGKNHTVVLM